MTIATMIECPRVVPTNSASSARPVIGHKERP